MTRRSLAGCALAAAWIGNAGAARAEGLPEPRPLGRALPSIAQSLDPSAPAGPPVARPEGDLTLAEALAAALLGNPTLASQAWEVRAREAQRLQASLRPNPQATLEVEDIGVDGEFAGAQASQVTLWLSQLLELGGKRDARTDLAARTRDLAGWDYERLRVDVLADTARDFYAVLGAQERLALTQMDLRVAEDLLATARERFEQGFSPELEVTRARVGVGQARLALQDADLELDHSRHTLSANWGEVLPRFERALGSLEEAPALPPRDALFARLDQSPVLARWDTAREERRAALRLAESRAVPDVTVVAGPRWIEEADTATAVAQVSVPLPFWDRNQGGIAEARHRLARLAAQERESRLHAESTLVDAYETLRGALAKVDALRDDILPEAQRALAEARAGWERGLYTYLDVLDAERELVALRIRYVEALAGAHREAAEVERVVAAPLSAAGAPDPGSRP